MNVLETYTQEEAVAHMLRTMGIAPHQCGWNYLNCAVNLAIDDAGYLRHITKGMYPAVAELVGATPSSVERGMRHSIVDAFNRACADSIMHQTFDDLVNVGETPCVSLFLATVVELYNREKHHPIFELRGAASEQ